MHKPETRPILLSIRVTAWDSCCGNPNWVFLHIFHVMQETLGTYDEERKYSVAYTNNREENSETRFDITKLLQHSNVVI